MRPIEEIKKEIADILLKLNDGDITLIVAIESMTDCIAEIDKERLYYKGRYYEQVKKTRKYQQLASSYKITVGQLRGYKKSLIRKIEGDKT